MKLISVRTKTKVNKDVRNKRIRTWSINDIRMQNSEED